jgi:hypothetical protein
MSEPITLPPGWETILDTIRTQLETALAAADTRASALPSLAETPASAVRRRRGADGARYTDPNADRGSGPDPGGRRGVLALAPGGGGIDAPKAGSMGGPRHRIRGTNQTASPVAALRSLTHRARQAAGVQP